MPRKTSQHYEGSKDRWKCECGYKTSDFMEFERHDCES